MNFVFQPWQLLRIILAGWLNRQQAAVIEYLRTENQVLKETHGTKRVMLNDDQRRRLAVKGRILGRKALEEIATIVTPDMILRWHRQLVAAKWDSAIVAGRNLGGPPCPMRSDSLLCKWPERIRAGAMIVFKGHWPIWVMRSRTRRWARFLRADCASAR